MKKTITKTVGKLLFIFSAIGAIAVVPKAAIAFSTYEDTYVYPSSSPNCGTSCLSTKTVTTNCYNYAETGGKRWEEKSPGNGWDRGKNCACPSGKTCK